MPTNKPIRFGAVKQSIVGKNRTAKDGIPSSKARSELLRAESSSALTGRVAVHCAQRGYAGAERRVKRGRCFREGARIQNTRSMSRELNYYLPQVFSILTQNALSRS